MGFVAFWGGGPRGPPPLTWRASFARLGPRKGGGNGGAAAARRRPAARGATALLHRPRRQIRGLAILLHPRIGAGLALHPALLHGGIVDQRQLGPAQAYDSVA